MNVGCGMKPMKGWLNLDNSWGVRIAANRLLYFTATRIGILNREQRMLVDAAREAGVLWADATKRVPLPDSSVEVLYSCHMMEHLEKERALGFLREALRVLEPAGIIRVVVPDLKRMAERYMADSDADAFLERLQLARAVPRTFGERLKFLLVGDRHHLWMYDASSMIRLLEKEGFEAPRQMPPGSTGIRSPAGLDLREREGESVYIEARKGGRP